MYHIYKYTYVYTHWFIHFYTIYTYVDTSKWNINTHTYTYIYDYIYIYVQNTATVIHSVNFTRKIGKLWICWLGRLWDREIRHDSVKWPWDSAFAERTHKVQHHESETVWIRWTHLLSILVVFGEFVLPKELLKLRRSFAITTCSVFESWKIIGNLQEVRLYLRTTRSNERHNKRCGNLPPVANFPRRTGFLWACLLLVAVGAEHRAFQSCLNMDNHVSSQWQSHCNHLQSGCKSGSSVTPALRALW